MYLGNDRPVPEHNPDMNAWPVHLVFTALLVVGLAVALWRHRKGRGSGLFLLTPIGKRAAARLRQTVRSSPWRSIIIVPMLVVMGYLMLRCGMQVTLGLNEAATINAWGGPTYLGAMYAHYLDAVLFGALPAGVIHLVMVREKLAFVHGQDLFQVDAFHVHEPPVFSESGGVDEFGFFASVP